MAPRPEVAWDQARCADPKYLELFDPNNSSRLWVRAKRVCQRCPIQQECLDEAIELGDIHGVRGGKSPGERIKMLRELNLPIGV